MTLINERCELEKERADETPFQLEMPTGQYGHKVQSLAVKNNSVEKKINGTARVNVC